MPLGPTGQSNLGGLAATNAALHGNFAPGISMAAQLAGLDAPTATALGIAGLGATHGPNAAIGPGATALGGFFGGQLGANLGSMVGNSVAAGNRGANQDSIINGLVDMGVDAVVNANPIGMALNAVSNFATGKGLTANTLGQYSQDFGTRVGGLLGAETMGDAPLGPQQFTNVYDSKFSNFGRTPTYMGFMAPKGFVSVESLRDDVQEPAPVVDAFPGDNPDSDIGFGDEGVTDVSNTAWGQESMPSPNSQSQPSTYDAYNDAAAQYGWSDAASVPSFGDVGVSDVSADGGGFGNYGDFSAPDSAFSGEGVSSVNGNTNADGTFGGSDGGSGSGGGDGTVICTELHRQGLMPTAIFVADRKFGAKQDANTMAGYHLWGVPLARLMKRSKLATGIVAMFAIPWAKHMAHTMGAHVTDNLFGKILMKTFKPVCKALGFIINSSLRLKGV